MALEGEAIAELDGNNAMWFASGVAHRFINASATKPDANLLELRLGRRDPQPSFATGGPPLDRSEQG